VLALIAAATFFAWWRVHHHVAPVKVAAPALPSGLPPGNHDWEPILPNQLHVIDDVPDPNAGKPRFGDCAVYVDGQPVAVLRYGELPPNLPVHWQKVEGEADAEKIQRFLMAEYLEQVGVDIRKVRELHLYGGQSRIGIVKGDELRRFARKWFFSFTRNVTGKPRMHPAGKDFHITDYIDTFATVAVYVEKPAPRWSDEVQGLVDNQGRDIEGIPYVKSEMRGGTRVYLDARLVSNIKRNLLSSTMATGQDQNGKPRYSLESFLRAQKVELPRIASIELVDTDRVVLAVRPDELTRPLEFETITDSSGTQLFHVSKVGGESQIEASLVRFYSRPHGAIALR
jgi:hypothetical protein